MAGKLSKHSTMRTALAGAVLCALAPQVAQAATPLVAVQTAEMLAGDCGSPVAAPLAANSPISIAVPAPSKSAQIIGGASALDAIRARQASAPSSHPLLSSAPAKPFEPAAAPLAGRSEACAISASPFAVAGPVGFAVPRSVQPLYAAATPRRDLVLGSRMVPIARTSFDAQWNRVSAGRTNLSATLRRVGSDGRGRADIVASVNRWVNREIRHAEDIELYGKSDYWADAATTLRLGKGDCEDFALLKMELLAAAGVAREDMILTLARDLIRRRDHAVLLVKEGDGWLMLDNVGSAPLDASLAHGYRPVMSLGAKQSWLHGY
ncbi:transglutaminase-like cysteine peptidase [Qipengyuania sphaerica]|uniref:transglutaminase-like cysteine peptidase n=1 Tax=Qipengyuania sphaerica TaxID=2867243 RepID=UPI001C8A3EEE|nr:transglutaminase-like cysteine peptidase [Qipengyuania sphaerica]MBX7542121.1 transglutaminase-like cysteine peptidase [Qipengyuania sphaerica]